ncbi:E3 ubiquitin-protein ligase CCNB1IP1 homolog isoform X2 [Andrographis paniculata]|nr:E3 ubiquitin-protein ligase CCNB1IP1 homolog isoform X2 [Andrographis paniculata]
MPAGKNWKEGPLPLPVVTSCALKMQARFSATMVFVPSAIRCSPKGVVDKRAHKTSHITHSVTSFSSWNVIFSWGCCTLSLVLDISNVFLVSLMRPVDVNPNDEWVNMAMAGTSPQIIMKSALRSVMFYIGQRDLEMQVKINKIVAQCRQKCEAMQAKFTEKLEQVYTAYQKMAKRCQMMEQEMENLTKDKRELQEKLSEKCRQKRKLDEMYDQARNEIDSLKRMAIQPADHFFSRPEPDLFSNPAVGMDNRDIRAGHEDIWPDRQKNSNFAFHMPGSSPGKPSAIPMDTSNHMPAARPSFGINNGGGGNNNPSMTLRNLIFSPIKRPQPSRSRPPLFT